ncbi:MAG: right-handed parallel beta-helix repeat-containing protein [Candidatus Odinarchaeota archaeon]
MKARIIIVLLLVFGLFIPLNSSIVVNSTPVTINGVSVPPSSGDWIINTAETLTGQTVMLNGSIYVNSPGSLTITNSELIFRGNALAASNGEFNLTVDGGTLSIEHSTITTDDPGYLTYINATNEATVSFSDSTFEHLGYETAYSTTPSSVNMPAIYLTDSYDVEITRCNLTTDGGLYSAIYLRNISNGEIAGSNIATVSSSIVNDFSGYGIFVTSCNATTISGNNITNSGSKGCALYVKDSPYTSMSGNILWSNNTYATLYLYGNGSYGSFINNVATNHKNRVIWLQSSLPKNSSHFTVKGNVLSTLGVDSTIVVGSRHDYLAIQNNTIHTESNTNNVIYISSTDNVSVLANIITGGKSGIYLTNSDSSLISDNRLEDTADAAILLTSLTTSTVSSNVIREVNPASSSANGISATDCLDITASGNRIDFTGGDGISFQNTNESLITGNMITNAGDDGIEVMKGVDNTISDNTVTRSNDAAFYTDLSSYLTINNNTFYSNYGNGIYVYYLANHHLDIKGNTIVDNNYGIYLTTPSHNCTVTENYIAENHYGAAIWGKDHVFYNNSFLFNFYGVYMQSNAEGNLLYYNDFIDNTVQAKDDSPYGANEWSRHVLAPESFIGNFWSDYDGVDVVAPSGVGDTPYNITGNNADLYPLMESITDLPPPVITSPSDVTILFNTTGNVIIWKATTILRPQTYTITVNGTEVYSGIWDGSPIIYSLDSLVDNATVYAVTITVYDSLGQATSDTVIVTVEEISGKELPIDLFSAGVGLLGGIVIMAVVMVILRRRG